MDTISAYFQLIEERPDLFEQSDMLPLILDESKIRTFSSKTGKPMGIVYDNSPFYLVLADLCQNATGLYRYARVISCNPNSGGCVAIPRWRELYGLLRIFRHAPRRWSIEFPRGFAENSNLTAAENVKKEISEELQISEEACQIRFLGEIRPDTGLSNGKVQLFLADLISETPIIPVKDEGIAGISWISEKTLRKMIYTGEITDGFTLSAYAHLICSEYATNFSSKNSVSNEFIF